MSSKPFEVSWFGSLCDDDYEFLGHREVDLRSTFEHCRGILQRAEEGGFDNILLPSGYQLGIDFRLTHFNYIQANLATNPRCKVLPQLFYVLALLPNNQTRTTRMDGYPRASGGTLDDNAADCGLFKTVHQIATHL